MATVIGPDPTTGSHPVPPRSAARPPLGGHPPRRLEHVDLLRGLVMVIMVLDHVRAYVSDAHFDPTDLTRTDTALFATRWITHFCAPAFVFLAGASAWIAGTRRTPAELSGFLVTRGVWLVVLELSVVTFGWYFTSEWSLGAVAQVIWAIGWSMVALAALIHLPRTAVAAFGLALVAGHNLFDAVDPGSLGALEPVWRLLHVQGPLGSLPLFVVYPLVPWVGVMALGYAAGPYVFSRHPADHRRLAWTGLLLVAAFVALRALDVYGDPRPRLHEGGAALELMSFLNATKYPPSLLFLLMTLGPALIALALLADARGRLARVLVTLGRVPFLFYVTHIYLVHALAVLIGTLQGLAPSATRVVFLEMPATYGVSLPVVYLLWLGVVVALYPLCRRYAELKGRSRAWWLSYL
ncbi:MAG TPA: heparan-alpha-glucosaminide N-acetyltransferase domain-containing protein [Gemmatimonadales bacterium]|nr:heparan-alpha-glucosaminide N-acetyltransferase domain-containing protein [Gemmatimonadales bacterium]